MVSGTALDVRPAVDAVCHAISAGRTGLSTELFPAHPSVARIDVAFQHRLHPETPEVPLVGQHCRRVGIARTGAGRPPAGDRETPDDPPDAGSPPPARALNPLHRVPGETV